MAVVVPIGTNQKPELDELSDEDSVFAALLELVAAGQPDVLTELAAAVGIPEQRLLADYRLISQVTGKPAPDAAVQLARDFVWANCQGGAHLRFDGRTFWRFDRRTWRPLPMGELKRGLLTHFLANPDGYGRSSSSSLVGGATHALCTMLYESDFPHAPREDLPRIVNSRSGELWLDDEGRHQLRPHRCWSRQTAVSPVDYDPAANCVEFDRAIAEIFSAAKQPADMVRHVMELMAYGLQPGREIPGIVLFRGAGANGKSLLLKILAASLDPDQVMWGSITRLSADPFTLPDLAGKRLFFDDDARDGARLDDGLLKSIAEDKPVSARRAHAPQSVSFRARALPVISTNGAPALADSSFGFERRLLVVPFERRFSEAEMDRGLADRIIERELSGILNHLLEAYQRLRERGRFQEPADCERAKIELLASANPLRAFLSQACRPAPGKRIALRDLYITFQSWCRVDGRKTPYTRLAFTNRIRSTGLPLHKSYGLLSLSDMELVAGDWSETPDMEDLG